MHGQGRLLVAFLLILQHVSALDAVQEALAKGTVINGGDTVFLKVRKTGACITLQEDNGETWHSSVHAKYHHHGLWQSLTIEKANRTDKSIVHSGDTIFLRGHTGKYVEVIGHKVEALKSARDLNQALIVEKESGDGPITVGDAIYIRAASSGRWLGIEEEGAHILVHARSSSRGPWQALVMDEFQPGPLDGRWTLQTDPGVDVFVIKGDAMHFVDDFETSITMKNDHSFTTGLHGWRAHSSGQLLNTGTPNRQLHWSNGDVWIPVQGPFDGRWTGLSDPGKQIIKIEGHNFTARGVSRYLLFLSRTEFLVDPELVERGFVPSRLAELVGLRLHWSSGEVWAPLAAGRFDGRWTAKANPGGDFFDIEGDMLFFDEGLESKITLEADRFETALPPSWIMHREARLNCERAPCELHWNNEDVWIRWHNDQRDFWAPRDAVITGHATSTVTTAANGSGTNSTDNARAANTTNGSGNVGHTNNTHGANGSNGASDASGAGRSNSSTSGNSTYGTGAANGTTGTGNTSSASGTKDSAGAGNTSGTSGTNGTTGIGDASGVGSSEGLGSTGNTSAANGTTGAADASGAGRTNSSSRGSSANGTGATNSTTRNADASCAGSTTDAGGAGNISGASSANGSTGTGKASGHGMTKGPCATASTGGASSTNGTTGSGNTSDASGTSGIGVTGNASDAGSSNSSGSAGNTGGTGGTDGIAGTSNASSAQSTNNSGVSGTTGMSVSGNSSGAGGINSSTRAGSTGDASSASGSNSSGSAANNFSTGGTNGSSGTGNASGADGINSSTGAGSTGGTTGTGNASGAGGTNSSTSAGSTGGTSTANSTTSDGDANAASSGNSSGSAGHTGGTSGTNGTNSTASTGNTSGAGGTTGSGGAGSTGGANGTNGTSGTGNASGAGGTTGSGGAGSTGGANGTNGTSGTGNASGAGGTKGSGGADDTGGASGINGTTGTGNISGAGSTNSSTGAGNTSGASAANGTIGTGNASGAGSINSSGGAGNTSGTGAANGTTGTDGTSSADSTEGSSGADITGNASGTASGSSGIGGTSTTNGQVSTTPSSPPDRTTSSGSSIRPETAPVSALTDSYCLEDEVTYEPMDMDGQLPTLEANVKDCRKRCRKIRNCTHFSFYYLTIPGSCHVQNIFGIRQTARVGFISGPPRCFLRKDHGRHGLVRLKQQDVGYRTFVPKNFSCLKMGRAYIPALYSEFLTNDKGYANGRKAVAGCRRKCLGYPGCEYYTMEFPTRLCSLSPASATELAPIFKHIAGPKICTRENDNVENDSVEEISIRKYSSDQKVLLSRASVMAGLLSAGGLLGLAAFLHRSGRCAMLCGRHCEDQNVYHSVPLRFVRKETGATHALSALGAGLEREPLQEILRAHHQGCGRGACGREPMGEGQQFERYSELMLSREETSTVLEGLLIVEPTVEPGRVEPWS